MHCSRLKFQCSPQLGHCRHKTPPLQRPSRHAASQTSPLQHQHRIAAAAPDTSLSTVESSVDEAVQSSGREALAGLGIAPLAAEALFDTQHVQEWTPALLAYAPLGCVLAFVRMAAWIGGIALDAAWFRNPVVVDAYMALLGVTVKWQDEHNIPATERHVLVSNHVSTGDLLLLFQRPQRYIHLITTALPQKVYACQHLPAILQPANKQTYLQLAEAQQQQQQPQQQQHAGLDMQHLQTISSSSQQADGVQHLQQQQHGAVTTPEASSSSQHASAQHAAMAMSQQQQLSLKGGISQQQQQEPSVHLFPEGGMTNGKGMMRFSRGFMLFADKLPVVPVALRVRGAFPSISSHTIDSSFLVNLFWCSFQPWTVIEARALPAMRLASGESKAAFVQRVQLAIAEELRVWIADLSIQQKRQLAGGQRGQGGGARKGKRRSS